MNPSRHLLIFLLAASTVSAQSLPSSEPSSTPATQELPQQKKQSEANDDHAEGLLLDVMHLVKVAQSAGWKIDKYEVEKLMPDALQSACLVDAPSRQLAQQKLSAQIASTGGSVEALYQKKPNIKKLRSELSLYRAQQLLEEAIKRADTDCPFYLTPQKDFQSLQGSDNRFLFVVESEGSVQLEKRGEQLSYGGGGFGRLLFGKGFDSAALLAGLELAGSGLLVVGAPASEFEVRYYMALPVLVRWTKINWQYEIETAPVFMFDETNLQLSYGIRGMVGFGVQSHRRQVFIPWGSLSLGIDHFFEGVRPTTDLIHAGFRAGFTFN